MSDNLLDLSPLLKVGEGLAGKRAVDLQTVDENGDGHKTVRLDILLETVVGGLIENDGVLGLVLDYGKKTCQRWCFSRTCCSRCFDRKLRFGEDSMMVVCVPLPLDHFFFCFFPPVAAGAWCILSAPMRLHEAIARMVATYHFV